MATALGNDPNFATTITNLIATKLPINSPSFTNILKNSDNTLSVDASGSVSTPSLTLNNTYITPIFTNLTYNGASYFTGFPKDQLGWVTSAGATYTNTIDMVAGVYAQQLNFTTSSGSLICPVPIQYVGTSCTLQVSV